MRTLAEDRPVLTCDTRTGLGRITRPEVDLVVWRRSLPPAFTDWIQRVHFSLLPSFRILARADIFPEALGVFLDRHGMPHGEMRDFLIDDIHGLALAFSGITGDDLVDMRLERIHHDACWKFHRDCVALRLLTTYRGPATQWVRHDRASEAIREQLAYSGPVETLQRHDVAVFKGNAQDKERGVVHRSPPVSKSGETRLLLCLNTASDMSPEEWRGG
ncbi:DUF1826 domain-containing protein [Hwanghaeella sp.]|uniref:DUF1826 domain-containing protein n=1 Tax=Hwanghaeella sp. TaxID=2605943 RepID=UPI003CCBB4EF